MVDIVLFAMAQKLVWIKYLIDKIYESFWGKIEIKYLNNFHPAVDLFLRARPPSE